MAAYLAEVWPLAGERFPTIERVGVGSVRLRRSTAPEEVRPGGTISGPALMALADTTSYVMLLARLGRASLTVTTHLSIDFLRRPEPGELVADGELVKLGRSLAVVAVRLYSTETGAEPDLARPVALASATYSRALVGLEGSSTDSASSS